MNYSFKVKRDRKNVLLIGCDTVTLSEDSKELWTALRRVGVDDVFFVPGMKDTIYLEEKRYGDE